MGTDNSMWQPLELFVLLSMGVCLPPDYCHLIQHTQGRSWERGGKKNLIHYRHSLEALINKVESDVRTVQDNLRINEEFSFESLHCLLYNVTQQGALPNNNFPTSDSRNVWEGNFARFIGGKRTIYK